MWRAFPAVDFARDNRARQRRRLLLWGGLALATSVQVGALIWRLQEIESERVELLQQQKRSQSVQAAPQRVSPPVDKQLNERLTAARAMLGSLSIPWEDLLQALEAAHTDKIAIESIRPEPSQGQVEIGFGVDAFADGLDFMRRLEESDALERVLLLSESHESSNGQGAGLRPLKLLIRARWRERSGS